MTRLPNTLATQLVEVIPQAAQLIGAAVKAKPALVSASLEPDLSLDTRLHCLVYDPFKAVVPLTTLLTHPYLIVIDGLDECEDKDGVEEFLQSTLRFFAENPYIPLRILITSRVEQHIQPLLPCDRVLLMDLGTSSSRDDIKIFLDIIFKDAVEANPVIQAYIRRHGAWPKPPHVDTLLEHIGGSFILASTLAKFILHGSDASDSCLTPIDRLPLAIKINPGLDGLYVQTLARAEDRAHFHETISTIALLEEPLPISGIAELIGIQPHEVVHVLVDLQAIIQVPGTDDVPVTFFHTSLRDFLTAESRSGRFFVPPSFHIRLLVHCLNCELRIRRQKPKVGVDFGQQTSAVQYSLEYRETIHWKNGHESSGLNELGQLVQLRREMLVVLPDHDRAGGLSDLGSALDALFRQSGSHSHIEEAISVYRESLDLRPHPHPDRHWSLANLGVVLKSLYRHSQSISHLEEAISMHRQALSLRAHPHADRHWSLANLGVALDSLYRRSLSISHLKEAISMHRQALSLRPYPHPARHESLQSLGGGLTLLFYDTKSISHIEEATPVFREAVSLRPHPHPKRHWSLNFLGNGLLLLFDFTGSISYIEEAIPVVREALSLRPHPHPERCWSLEQLGLALHRLSVHTASISHVEEAIPLLREALSLRPHPHSRRPWALDFLGAALCQIFSLTGSIENLDEAISLRREALNCRAPPPFSVPMSLEQLIRCLEDRYGLSSVIGDLDEAITYARELAFEHDLEAKDRDQALEKLQFLLQQRFDATGKQEDLDEIEKLREGEETEWRLDLLFDLVDE
ncbi:hypothetical protein EST38_g4006 [Candolleomyces aberdarensis]|uniref:Nephrocystin 3-like N-terminal domain-containing protein n=1 Tax=Candolleomyces aberdarensis TaxID=2316362 RepID=A0A4Q2DNZ2_9AGAR|nr:hypothetical protein EST38_g4006 [Candolleomyces aberdarensis]